MIQLCVPIIDPRDAEIARLKAELAKALERIAELEALLRMNSGNSSKPPSSDGVAPGRVRRRKRGRRRGGQPGHKPFQRKLFPPEKVTRVRRITAKRCGRCGSRELRERPGCRRHQVVDLPKVEPDVTEFQLFDADCLCCGYWARAVLPPEVPQGAFGPGLLARIALCTVKYRMSKRSVKEMLLDFFGIEISLGAIPHAERFVAAAVAAPVEEAREYVRRSLVVQPDETGWREKKRRAWLWTARTRWVTVFQIARSRGSAVARRILGRHFAGTIVSDRWCAYAWVDPQHRQLCWAHLDRDFTGMTERAGPTARIGRALTQEVDRLFETWQAFKAGRLTRRQMRRRLAPVQRRVGRLLRRAARQGDRKAAGMARDILKVEPALWTFATVEGVEPTNNAAEQVIRTGVMWRKTSFGTDSRAGSRFVERLLTVTTTLRQQARHLLDYLTSACRALLAHQEPPSLLPLHEPA